MSEVRVPYKGIEIIIYLQTEFAKSLYNGEEGADIYSGVIGMEELSRLLGNMEEAIKQDDPYADYYYMILEEDIQIVETTLQAISDVVDMNLEENTPPSMELVSAIWKKKIKYKIYDWPRLANKILCQILKMDRLIFKILIAHTIGAISMELKETTIGQAEKIVRELFQFVYNCDYTDVTREDLELNNEKSKEAISRYGELELSILDGSKRSAEAPRLPMRALGQIKYLNGQHQYETEKVPQEAD